MYGEGYQWWPLSELNPAAMTAGAASAAPAIDAFIDRKLAQYGLTEDNLAIVGFSQGTMMALHVGLRRQRQVASIVGYSGMLTGAQELAHVPIRKPPVLLVHGDADPIVPVSALHYAQTELERQGVPVTSHVSRGLGHSVDETGLRLGQDFIARGLASDVPGLRPRPARWPAPGPGVAGCRGAKMGGPTGESRSYRTNLNREIRTGPAGGANAFRQRSTAWPPKEALR
jgi:phospholipase/carboxylesterase